MGKEKWEDFCFVLFVLKNKRPEDVGQWGKVHFLTLGRPEFNPQYHITQEIEARGQKFKVS